MERRPLTAHGDPQGHSGISPPNVASDLNEALQFHRTGDLTAAESGYRRVLARQPDHAEALHLVGLVAHQGGRNVEAAELIERAIACGGRNPVHFGNYAAVLSALGKHKASLAASESALALKPDFPEAHNNAGNSLRALGRVAEAAEAFAQATALKPDLVSGLNNLGIVLQELGRLDEAAVQFARVLELQPQEADALFNLAALRQFQGQQEQAAELYTQVLALNPRHAKANNNLGLLAESLGEFEDAVMCFCRAVEAEPEGADFLTNLGRALHHLGEFDTEEVSQSLGRVGIESAEAAYRRAIEVKPDLAVSYTNLATLLNTTSGRVAVTKMLREFAPPTTVNAVALGALAHTLSDGDGAELNEAAALVEKALALDPGCGFAAAVNAKVQLEQDTQRDMGQMIRELPDNWTDSGVAALSVFHTAMRQQHYEVALELAIGQLDRLETVTMERFEFLINMAIIYWLQREFGLCHSNIEAAARALGDNPAMPFMENLKIYENYLMRLCEFRQANVHMYEERAPEVLHVIGESHVLSLHGLDCILNGAALHSEGRIIIGCKAWHLAQPAENYFKRAFRGALQGVPHGSAVVFAMGEIDCRHDEGILAAANKTGECVGDIARRTAEGYADFAATAARVQNHRPIFWGVPAPDGTRASFLALSQEARVELTSTIREFNSALATVAEERGCGFLDVHALTDDQDGASTGEYHIDGCHLQPRAFVETLSELPGRSRV